MPDESPEQEERSVRTTMMFTPTEKAALEFLHEMHPGRWSGYTDVLRDYSLNEAVAAHRRAKALTNTAAA